jgi:hypothetical protein
LRSLAASRGLGGRAGIGALSPGVGAAEMGTVRTLMAIVTRSSLIRI